MQKKISIIILSLVCVVACALSLAACQTKETHTAHNWLSTYIEDGDRHYQTCDGCNEKNYSSHVYGTSGVCVCGKEKSVETHTHNYQWVDNGDGTHKQHCFVSECTEPDINSGSHDYGTRSVCVCGKEKPGEAHTHNYQWVDNGDGTHKQHCFVSGCTELDINSGNHDYGTGDGCVCGAIKPVVGHKHYTTYVAVKTASCTESGNIAYYTCGCGKWFYDANAISEITNQNAVILDAFGHNIVSHGAKAATCTEGGWNAYNTCSHCDYTTYSEISATGHSFVNYISDSNATCTVDGTKTSRCELCNETKTITDTDSKLGHSFVNYLSDGNATCTEDGTKTSRCERCSETNIIKQTALGHNYLNYVCTRCGDEIYTEDLEYIGIKESGEVVAYSVCGIGYATDNEIIIPSSYKDKPVISIGDRAFSDCSNLTSITIPDSVTSIGIGAFSGTAYYNDESNWENEVLYIGKHLIDVKRMSSFYDIKSGTITIANSAFAGLIYLERITIPDSVTSIGDSAFEGCKKLASITIPNSVTSIGDSAFKSCYDLKSITISDSATSIGHSAFSFCLRVTSITIPDSVIIIGNYAFLSCSALTSLTIGDSVTSIGDYAFDGCSGLTSITIPDSVTSIGEKAFMGCSGLTSITIPGSVTSIGIGAFSWCGSLKNVYWNATNCKNAGSSINPIFGKCEVLTTVTIGNNVTSIPSYAFVGCSGLKEVVWNAESCTSAGSYNNYIFKDCTNLATVIVGDTVKKMPDYAFAGCSGLKEVIWNAESCTSAGSYNKYIFNFCTNLTKVTFSKNIEVIPSYVFAGCGGLKNVYYYGTMEDWEGINIGSGNEILSIATIYFYSEKMPTEDGNYWHYVDGEMVIWAKVD